MATAKKTTSKKVTKPTRAKSEAASIEGVIYNAKGAKAGTITLPGEIFGLSWNADLVHQVVTSMQANARGPIAHAKDRSEVRGGGRKPWKQKGTGRARHGSSRSPIWVGGGTTHGPRNDKSYAKKINRSMRRKALFVALSRKFRDGEVLFVDTLGLAAPKAAQAKTILTGLSSVKGFERMAQKSVNAALIATAGNEPAVRKSFGNFRSIEVIDASNLNPLAILSAAYLVIVAPQESIEVLTKRSVA